MALTTKKGIPITGGRTAMQPRPPVLTNQATTSADAQRQVNQPPAPFANPYGPRNVPAPPNRAASHPYGKPAKNLLPKQAGARMERSIGVGATGNTTPDMLAAVGEPRLPKGYNPVNSGFPLGTGKRKK